MFQKSKDYLRRMKNLKISGPFYNFSCPYGTFVTLERDEWFISRKLESHEQKTEIQKILKSESLGRIIKFRNRKDYVIDQLYPRKAFKTLKSSINFLIKNRGKLTFCS